MNAEHIIQIGVSVDDDAIRKAVINAATKELADAITETYVEKDNSYYRSRYVPKNALNNIISAKADALIEKHGDMIVETAINKVAEKLYKSKRVKDFIKSLEAET